MRGRIGPKMAAQDRRIVDQRDLSALVDRGQRCRDSGRATTDDGNVCVEVLMSVARFVRCVDVYTPEAGHLPDDRLGQIPEQASAGKTSCSRSPRA